MSSERKQNDGRTLGVVVMAPPEQGLFHFDYAAAFETACRELELPYRIVSIPYTRADRVTRAKVAEIRETLEKLSKDHVVIFCPGLAELFVPGAHLSLHFSAYRSWYDPLGMRVIPHIWTWSDPERDLDVTEWTIKPPLNIGFMGTTYVDDSRLANLFMRAPKGIKRVLLQGRHLKNANWFAFLMETRGLNMLRAFSFPRMEVIDILEQKIAMHPAARLEITEAAGFNGSQAQKDKYRQHMLSMTYIICPRGCENFSFRMYEALKFGRVPVIIDTEMVLPPEIDWENVALLVPYGDLDRLCDIVVDDYENRSREEFIERQRIALTTMRSLQNNDWIKDVLLDAASVGSPASSSAPQGRL